MELFFEMKILQVLAFVIWDDHGQVVASMAEKFSLPYLVTAV